jgi:hypothetical protein
MAHGTGDQQGGRWCTLHVAFNFVHDHGALHGTHNMSGNKNASDIDVTTMPWLAGFRTLHQFQAPTQDH